MRKINNWNDYNKLVKEETYNVAKIEDTYIYQLESELEETKEKSNYWMVNASIANKNIIDYQNWLNNEREENKKLKKTLRDVIKKEYGHGGAHQMFFEELTEVNDILEETKDQSILLPRFKKQMDEIVAESFGIPVECLDDDAALERSLNEAIERSKGDSDDK